MSQQLGIILMIDIEGALSFGALDGNIYLFDNMGPYGSTGQGTGDLISAINGAYHHDGSQATEEVLNWLSLGIGSLPPTLPRTFEAQQVRKRELESLRAINDLSAKLKKESMQSQKALSSMTEEIHAIEGNKGINTEVKNQLGETTEHRLMNVFGEFAETEDQSMANVAHLTPIITNITGEAVEKKIIYPAQYGSPDTKNDGWYWSASVATNQPGTYSYTMHITLYELVRNAGKPYWKDVQMAYDSFIKITSHPKVNGFTGSGLGLLPIDRPPHYASNQTTQQEEII